MTEGPKNVNRKHFTEYSSFAEFYAQFQYFDHEPTAAELRDLKAQGITPYWDGEGCHDGWSESKWVGGTAAETHHSATEGNLSVVEAAEGLMDQVEASVSLDGLREAWAASPVGAMPNVPAFLAGQPESMWHKQRNLKTASMSSEIDVFYTPVVSGAISEDECIKRGTVVLAAVMALSKVRPVNLYYYTTLGNGDHIVKIQTNPIRLSEAAWAISSGQIFRGLSYRQAKQQSGWQGRWAAWCGMGSGGDYKTGIAAQREALELGPDDVLIPGMHVDNMGMMKDPVAWINQLLDKYRDNAYQQ